MSPGTHTRKKSEGGGGIFLIIGHSAAGDGVVKHSAGEIFLGSLLHIFQSSRGLDFLFTNFELRETLFIQPFTSCNILSVNSRFFNFIKNQIILFWLQFCSTNKFQKEGGNALPLDEKGRAAA